MQLVTAARSSRQHSCRHSLFGRARGGDIGAPATAQTVEHPQTGKFLSPDPTAPPLALLNIHTSQLKDVFLGVSGLKADK